MAQLRVKIELNKGRHGIPVHKLAEVAKEAEKFFQMFAADVRLGKGEWIAENFRNGSLGYDIAFVGAPTDAALLTGYKAFDYITSPEISPDDLKYGIRKETFLQFARIAAPVDADDFVSIGIYNGEPEPQMRELTKERFLEIEKEVTRTVIQYGGMQGVITAFFNGSNLFWLRELSTGERVSCTFPVSMYNKVWKLLESKDAILNVEGWITITSGKIEHLRVATLDQAAEYQEGDLEKLFGCDPNFTGNLSTEEYLDDLRGETTEDYIKHLTGEDE